MILLALAAIVTLAVFASGWLIGRAVGLEEGYDRGRAVNLEEELAAGDAFRCIGEMTVVPEFVDAVERRWV